MLEAITVSELPRSTEYSAEKNVEVFKLQVKAVHFGYLYLGQGTYTIAWDGILDFHYLDETARFFLYKQLDDIKSSLGFTLEKYKRKFSLEKYEADVSIIYSGELIKFHFDYSEEPDEYKKMLEDPDQISFARYDFQLKSIPFRCSFTAENPQGASPKDRELALLLPRSRPITKSLLRWIAKNHVSFRELRLHFDYHYSTPILAKLIETGSA